MPVLRVAVVLNSKTINIKVNIKQKYIYRADIGSRFRRTVFRFLNQAAVVLGQSWCNAFWKIVQSQSSLFRAFSATEEEKAVSYGCFATQPQLRHSWINDASGLELAEHSVIQRQPAFYILFTKPIFECSFRHFIITILLGGGYGGLTSVFLNISEMIFFYSYSCDTESQNSARIHLFHCATFNHVEPCLSSAHSGHSSSHHINTTDHVETEYQYITFFMYIMVHVFWDCAALRPILKELFSTCVSRIHASIHFRRAILTLDWRILNNNPPVNRNMFYKCKLHAMYFPY